MSSRGGNGGVGVQAIPAGSRKVVQSLKEIVNCPEPEIYAMLKECNMDPNEAVNRLLTQDTFHEVKSKREKRKESKDTTESRPRGSVNNSGRGSRGGAERYVGRGGSEPTKPTPGYKKENGSYTSNLASTPGVSGSNISRRAATISDAAANETKRPASAAVDGVSSVSQHSSGYQHTWGGVPGQVSMADIVKMGKPQSKVPSIPNVSHRNVNANQNHIQGIPSGASHQNIQFSDDHTSNVSDVYRESGDYRVQHHSTDEEWPLIEQPSVASQPSISEPPADSELHPDPANISYDRINHQTEIDEVQGTDDSTAENLGSPPSRNLQEENTGGASIYENDLYRFQNQNHTFDHQDAEDVNVSVSSVAANLQQLNVHDDRGLSPEGDGPSVVIPDHLQVQTADCSHLSFGSFGAGIGGSFSGPLASAPVKTSLEDAPKDVEGSSVGHLGSRAPEYYGDESLGHASESNLYHRTNASSGNYDSPSASQPEQLKTELSEHGNQYSYPSSAGGYTYETAQQLTAAFSQPQTSSQMQNLASFSNVMAFTNSLPSTLLAANVHAGRESDPSYSPFSATQAMPTKYGNSVSSIGGSTISMPESLRTVGFQSAQPTQQTLSGTSVTTGPAVPQHLAVHPYSQPTLPLGPFANMISYPFMPQSYTYMPSAFQQPFAGNSTYHQSLAAVLPQYKNSVSVSSLPQSASVASGYGGFGNTTTIPGNFPMNPPAAPSGTNLSYDDMLSSQYKDTNHLMSLQQGENSAMWLHGPGSRTMSAVPANTYYGFQGQNQQSGGFRQAQQPMQNHGSLGYPNFYHSQAGISLEHQQQNPRDGSLGASQGQPKQSQQQLWQNSY
ncbi:uncharacterized protein [Nicotiana sylvestris]|uniref:Uncharacterized protein LOC104234138 isoform X2 n=1 Tax=Nicotiana sylvestris TaxID=4096 RepID=A0A1U7X1D6_NICSY|nr:PREDICTED: uncharacterized protein LOC104234138 isoform X2 [Nicotiana sylvestris]